MDKSSTDTDAQRKVNQSLLKSYQTAKNITDSMEFSSESLSKQKYKLENTSEKYGKLSKVNKTAKQLLKNLKKRLGH